jgi:hypothetical protein
MAGLLVGCERQPDPGPPVAIETLPADRAPDGLADLRAILDRRSTAVRRGDERAFLADLDRSNRDLIDQERLVFANLRQFEFRELRLVANRISFGAPDPDRPGGLVFSPVVQISQLTADSAPGGVAPAEAFRYKLARKGGAPVVTDIVALTRANARKLNHNSSVLANAPWNSSRLKVVHVGDVWVAGDDSVADLDRYVAAAAKQSGKVKALWGDRPRFPGHILFLSRDRAALRRWFDVGKLIDDVEGLEIPLFGVRTSGKVYDGQYAGSRIVVNLANFGLFGDDPEFVIRHELAHAVTAKATAVSLGGGRVDAPRWALEGFARWVESMESPVRRSATRAAVTQGVRAGRFSGAPPENKTFYEAANIEFNYGVSASIFTLIEQRHDRDTAVEFYAQAIKHNGLDAPALKAGGRAFDQMCRQVLGTGAAAFLGDWSGYVRGGA